MKYIDYHEMKEFYTIQEVCRLFEMEKPELKKYCEKYGIEPQEDLYGNFGFPKKELRQLHNKIYKEQKSNGIASNFSNGKKADPWA